MMERRVVHRARYNACGACNPLPYGRDFLIKEGSELRLRLAAVVIPEPSLERHIALVDGDDDALRILNVRRHDMLYCLVGGLHVPVRAVNQDNDLINQQIALLVLSLQ